MVPRLERATLVVLALSALALAGVTLRREFLTRGPAASSEGDSVEYVENWQSIAAAGIRFGNSSSPITVVEFADLECQFCRRFHEVYENAKVHFGHNISLVFVHFPLPSHRFARPAARAVECADEAGKAASFVDVVFAKQDSLGLKSWAELAAEAQITDTIRFTKCVKSAATIARIENGVALGKQLGVRGTPTVLVNGWRFAKPPSDAELLSTVRSLISGRP